MLLAQREVPLANLWGGGEVASADGMRFVVPVHTVHAGPNPKYFKEGRGVTWHNLISDQYSGINNIVVPGTLKDSLVILAVVLEQQTDQMPYQIMTNTGAYSDVIFGLFRLLGYRFCPSRQPSGCGLSWPEITVIKTDNIIVFQLVIWPVQLNPVNENLPLKEANFPAMS